MRTLLLLVVLGELQARFVGQTVHQDMNSSGQSSTAMDQMPGMDHSRMKMPMGARSLSEVIEQHATSGTDAVPAATPSDMLMISKGKWRLMLHGEAFLNEIQQTGPRGADKLFSTNWVMPMAQRKLGKGTLTLRAMLSLEPATVTSRRYPELFQQGETAFGRPVVDGQHPHDFFMEIAALYDYKLPKQTLLSFYVAPVGDPALGPVAYPHRASAAEDPVAPLGHHLEDSTHIASDVVTLGITYRSIRLEASGFHGREPDEFRWDVNSGGPDSWAARFTVNPAKNWSMQYSIGRLHSPEALSPSEDVRRMTVSLMYNRPLQRGNWASLLLWGRNQNLTDGNVGNGYLVESTLSFASKNNVWGRVENVDRTNELVLGENPLPPGFEERYFARVQAYTAGYDREIARLEHLSAALGGQLTAYGAPAVLRGVYGSNPVGAVAFLRIRLR